MLISLVPVFVRVGFAAFTLGLDCTYSEARPFCSLSQGVQLGLFTLGTQVKHFPALYKVSYLFNIQFQGKFSFPGMMNWKVVLHIISRPSSLVPLFTLYPQIDFTGMIKLWIFRWRDFRLSGGDLNAINCILIKGKQRLFPRLMPYVGEYSTPKRWHLPCGRVDSTGILAALTT